MSLASINMMATRALLKAGPSMRSQRRQARVVVVRAEGETEAAAPEAPPPPPKCKLPAKLPTYHLSTRMSG